MRIRWTNGSTLRALIGPAEAAAAIIASANAADLCFRTEASAMRWAVGGTAQTMSLSSTNLVVPAITVGAGRSEEHTSELQSLMRISYAVFCLKKKISLHPPTT